MVRGKGAGMAGVEPAKKGHSLVASHLAHDDPVGPHAQRCSEEVLRGHGGLAQTAAHGYQPDGVVMGDL